MLPLACSAGFGVPNALVLVFPNALDAPPKAEEARFPNKDVVVPVAAGVVEPPPAAVDVVLAADGKPKRFPLVVVDDPLGFPNRFLSVMVADERDALFGRV